MTGREDFLLDRADRHQPTALRGLGDVTQPERGLLGRQSENLLQMQGQTRFACAFFFQLWLRSNVLQSQIASYFANFAVR